MSGSGLLVAQWHGCDDRRALWGRTTVVTRSTLWGACSVTRRERGAVASNVVGAARKPPANTNKSPVRAARAQGVSDVVRHPAADSVAPRRSADWRAGYTRRLWLSDLVALIVVAFGTQIAWFGLGSAQVSIREDSRLSVVSVLALLRAAGDRVDVVAEPHRFAQRPRDRHRVDGVHPDHLGEHQALRHHRDPRVPAADRRGPRLPADRLPARDAVPPARAVALASVARGQARSRRVQRPRRAGRLGELRRADQRRASSQPERRLPRRRRLRAARHPGRDRAGHRHPHRRHRALGLGRAGQRPGRHGRDLEHGRAAAVGGQADLVAARGRSPAPRARTEHHRRRRPADPDAAGRRAAAHPRGDAALQQGPATRQARAGRSAGRGRPHPAQPGAGDHRARHPSHDQRAGPLPAGPRRSGRPRVPAASSSARWSRTPKSCCPISRRDATRATRCCSR